LVASIRSSATFVPAAPAVSTAHASGSAVAVQMAAWTL
jgi:hypothetical protein